MAPNVPAALIGLVRLAHPFPSLLTASATTVIACLAGAPVAVALRLGVAMLAMQASIGALNDIVDAPLDARQKPWKPIPAGLVGRRTATWVAAAGALAGVLLSGLSGPATAVAAVTGLGLGYLYDSRLSRTVVSWLPLSLALPILPIHAWLGARATVPDGLLTLIPVGVLGGAGLALANGLVDLERDGSTGRRAATVALGPVRAWLAQTVALAAAATLAVAVAPAVPDGHGDALDVLRMLRLGGVGTGVGAIALGAVALRAAAPRVRERGWELEAIGVAAIGVGWLAGTAAAGGGVGA